MNAKIPAVFCWSGGKDSSYALHKIFQAGIYEVKYLLSTFSGVYKRLSMHGVREELIEAQADSIGIPLLKVFVYEASNAEYEQQMEAMFKQVKAEGIKAVIYGDIFLADLRQYREEKMKPVGLECVFPIWKTDTKELIKNFLNEGFKTIICCINDGYLTEEYAGKTIDGDFVGILPEHVDACGENGEFHSFCFEGPVFKKPIKIKTGEKMYRPLEIKLTDHPTPIKQTGTKGFWFVDLIPVLPQQGYEVKDCPRCHQLFECRVNDIANCQCQGVVAGGEVWDFISSLYSNCLCKNCLLEICQKYQTLK